MSTNTSNLTLVQRLTDKPNLILDFETLGLLPSAEVLSLGIALIDFTSADDPYRRHIVYQDFWNIVTNECTPYAQPGRTREVATYSWWMAEERVEQWRDMQYNQIPLREVMLELINGLTKHGLGAKQDYYIWGNGADFDIPILSTLQAETKVKLPGYSYRNHRCLRTVQALWPQVQDRLLSMEELHLVPHTAEDDAEYEARWLCELYDYLTESESENKS